MQIRTKGIAQIIKIHILLLVFLFAHNYAFSSCPIDALKITLKMKKNISGKISIGLKDKLGKNKIDLVKIKNKTYQGVLNFATSGFAIFIELKCNYFPKYLKIYVDDKAIKKIKLKKNDFNKSKCNNAYDKNNDEYHCNEIYDVNINLEL